MVFEGKPVTEHTGLESHGITRTIVKLEHSFTCGDCTLDLAGMLLYLENLHC
jgi:hypothetical protein